MGRMCERTRGVGKHEAGQTAAGSMNGFGVARTGEGREWLVRQHGPQTAGPG